MHIVGAFSRHAHSYARERVRKRVGGGPECKTTNRSISRVFFSSFSSPVHWHFTLLNIKKFFFSNFLSLFLASLASILSTFTYSHSLSFSLGRRSRHIGFTIICVHWMWHSMAFSFILHLAAANRSNLFKFISIWKFLPFVSESEYVCVALCLRI